MHLLGEAFPNSRQPTRAKLAAGARIQSFRRGQALVRQDEPASIGLLLDGHVAARRATADGRQLIVRIADRGRLVPLLPLAAKLSTTDCIALNPSTAALWPADELRTLALADGGLGMDFLDHVAAALESLVVRMDDMVHRNTVRRVARVLQLNSDLFFGAEPVLSRADLVDFVGASREMTGRVLRQLERRHIVARVPPNKLRLLDPVGLAAAARDGLATARQRLAHGLMD